MDHLGHPVERGVGVAPSEAFDESADGVEVVVPLLVVEHGPALDRLFGDGQGQADDTGGRFGRLDGQFEGVEHRTRVAAGDVDQVVERAVLHNHMTSAKATCFVFERGVDHGTQVRGGQRDQLEDPTAADECLVDLEVGVLRRGANEDDRSIFDPGEQRVLLCFVEPMNFVDEEDRALPREGAAFFCARDGGADVLDAGEDCVERLEVGLGGVCDDPRQRRLARAWRAVEDEASELISLNRAPQEATWTDDMVLAYELVERSRAHASGERRLALELILESFFEEIHPVSTRRLLETSAVTSTLACLPCCSSIHWMLI